MQALLQLMFGKVAIISIILSVLAKKIAEASYLLIPTILLLCIAVTTIVFAVLTTKPKVSKGRTDQQQGR
jgi:hypothetical protein